MPGFVFFDTETTGLRPEWDQIVQFAAIRTDHELNELARFEVRARLQPHVVPHPRALLTNGIPIERLCNPDLPSHYEMICRVARLIETWSPAIFVGYNSIGFDEEMLRHALFQSLHDPYLTSRYGNGRADALTLMLAAHSQPPHAIKAPRDADGRPRFRLAGIAGSNGVALPNAHDAMADAAATLELCRLVKAGSGEVWQRFQRFATKAGVAQFVEAEDGFILSEFFGGQAYHQAVAVLGQIPGNPNGRLCLKLSEDPDVFGTMSHAEMAAALRRKGSPVRRLAVNGAPAIAELWTVPEDFLDGLDLEVVETRARRLKDDPALCARIIAVYTEGWQDSAPSAAPEECLYSGGFPDDADCLRRATFHEAGRTERCRIVGEFNDPRLAYFGHRLIYSEHRGALSTEDRRQADLELLAGLREPGRPHSLVSAVEALEALAAQEADPAGVLAGYRRWLEGRLDKTRTFEAANPA